MSEPTIELNGRKVGRGYSVYVIAEMSANHHQNFDTALRLLRAAKEAGADAIKLQTYTPETMTLNIDVEMFRHREGSLWSGKSLHGLYSEAYMPWEWTPKLQAEARSLGIDLFSTAYDPTAVDFLEEAGVPAYKVASFEIVDISLIEKIARTGKPVIMSTGMATLAEIEEAVGVARRAGAEHIALLKCTSDYPASATEMNLRTIPHMSQIFRAPVGLSDHTLETTVPVAAVSLGACIVEKHLTLSRSMPGPDSAFSLEPGEFKAMVDAIRTAERALGTVAYGPTSGERQSLEFRRSLFVVKRARRGEVLTQDHIRSIRSRYGLHTRELGKVIGRRAAGDIEAGTPLRWDMVEEES